MVYWIIATLCAFFVKGLCGFANTLVFTSILSFGTDNINISPVELILGYPSNLIIAIKERKSIDIKICIPLSLMVISGSLLGVFFLKNADTALVKIICGAAIVIVGLEMMLREIMDKNIGGSKPLLLVIGILSGILCGMYGIGALLGAYLGRVTDDIKVFKANICLVFIVENTFRLVLYGIYGIITLGALKRAVSLIPFMLIGLACGMLSSRYINENLAKKIVAVLLIASGIALIVMNI